MSLTENISSTHRWRWLDLTYWLVMTPLVTGSLTRLSTIGVFGIVAIVWPRPSLSLAWWIEVAFALVLADLVGYWSHRIRHCGWLWYFHAIHHSPARLDALSGARMHPIDDLIDNTLVGGVLFIAGFPPSVIFAIGPILFAHLALIHADVSWRFGPFARLVVSPAHHRAHHELRTRSNYAGMFSAIDVLFGTYAKGSGNGHGSGEPIPESLSAHMLWPLKSLWR